MDKTFMKNILFVLLGIVVFWVAMNVFGKHREIDIYCISEEGTKLVVEKRKIQAKSNNDIIRNTVEQLKNKPNKQNYKQVLTANVDIQRTTLKDGVLEIDFTRYYRDLSDEEKRFLTSGVVKTFQQYEFVEGVYLYVDGESLKNESGENIGLIKNKDIIIDEKEENIEKDIVLKLYFSNEEADALLVEERKVKIKNTESVEEKIISELIKGPESKNLIQTVPLGTKIKEVKIKDDICYVDLSEEFVKNHPGGSTGGMLTINSIVNSLTERPKIDKVQFLINGDIKEMYKGEIEINKPIQRN